MPTTIKRSALPPEAVDIPEVEYPYEVIERLNREFQVAKAQLATGELKPMSAADFAAEYGITIDG